MWRCKWWALAPVWDDSFGSTLSLRRESGEGPNPRVADGAWPGGSSWQGGSFLGLGWGWGWCDWAELAELGAPRPGDALGGHRLWRRER